MKHTYERRSGKDRRQSDLAPSNGKERRRSVESRKPEIAEISISDDDWSRYFGKRIRPDQSPT